MRRSLVNKLMERRRDVGQGAVAGLLGGAAFLAVMAIDLRLTGRNVDDVAVLGRFVADDPGGARVAGLLIHTANSAALGGLYALVAPMLPGSPWLKGTIYANVENVILYPIAAFEDHHPGIADGSIDQYWTVPAFLQSIPRHVAYGAVLGAGYAWLQARNLRRDR